METADRPFQSCWRDRTALWTCWCDRTAFGHAGVTALLVDMLARAQPRVLARREVSLQLVFRADARA